MKFIASNEKTKKKYRIDAVALADAYEWIVKHLDLSLGWSLKKEGE